MSGPGLPRYVVHDAGRVRDQDISVDVGDYDIEGSPERQVREPGCAQMDAGVPIAAAVFRGHGDGRGIVIHRDDRSAPEAGGGNGQDARSAPYVEN